MTTEMKGWLIFSAIVMAFIMAGGSTKSTATTPVIQTATILDGDNKKSFDAMIDTTAALVIYHNACAKLPEDIRVMTEKIALNQHDLVVAAGVKKKHEIETVGNMVWCAHWRNIITEVKAGR